MLGGLEFKVLWVMKFDVVDLVELTACGREVWDVGLVMVEALKFWTLEVLRTLTGAGDCIERVLRLSLDGMVCKVLALLW